MKINGISSSLGTVGTGLAALMATGQIPAKAMQWAALALGIVHLLQAFTGSAVTPSPAEQAPKSVAAGNGL